MSRRDALDVVIVGAGVVGSAAALALAQAGLRVALVEAHEPAPWRAESPDLRVFALAADASSFLGELGAWPAISAARAHPYRRMTSWRVTAVWGDHLAKAIMRGSSQPATRPSCTSAISLRLLITV